MTDFPAPALGALYDVLTRCVGTYQACALSPKDAAAIIRHIDTQAARLAAYRAVLAEVAADNDPRDGCAHSDAAKAVLDDQA